LMDDRFRGGERKILKRPSETKLGGNEKRMKLEGIDGKRVVGKRDKEEKAITPSSSIWTIQERGNATAEIDDLFFLIDGIDPERFPDDAVLSSLVDLNQFFLNAPSAVQTLGTHSEMLRKVKDFLSSKRAMSKRVEFCKVVLVMLLARDPFLAHSIFTSDILSYIILQLTGLDADSDLLIDGESEYELVVSEYREITPIKPKERKVSHVTNVALMKRREMASQILKGILSEFSVSQECPHKLIATLTLLEFLSCGIVIERHLRFGSFFFFKFFPS
jgi:hypothetical protein